MSAKRRMRSVIDHGARWSGVLAALERRMRRAPTVLMYHRILPDEQCADYPFPSLVMPLSMFEQQVHWLSERARVSTLRDAAASFGSGRELGDRPTVALTFDDGYRDNVEHAAPVLARHGVHATFFVTTDFVEHGTSMWYDRAALALLEVSDEAASAAAAAHGMAPPSASMLAAGRIAAWVEAMKRVDTPTRLRVVDALEAQLGAAPDAAAYGAMAPQDVARLAAAGHEIGAHSVSHGILTLLDDATLRHEIVACRATLARWAGREVDGFCYPNGTHDERVVAAVRDAGYSYACTTAPPRAGGAVESFRIPRIDVTPSRVTDAGGEFDLVAFRAELCGLHEVMR